jgi:hypothetical protein
MNTVDIKPPDKDLAQRRFVWHILSELFLDTELTEKTLHSIGKELRASPYTWEQLEYILWREVYPVCIWNLRVVAGEWAMFDGEWLEQQILARERMRFRLPPRFFTGKWMIAEEWLHVKQGFEALLPPDSP